MVVTVGNAKRETETGTGTGIHLGDGGDGGNGGMDDGRGPASASQ